MNRMQRKKLSLAIVNALNAGVVVGLAVPMAYAQQSPVPAVSALGSANVPLTRWPVFAGLGSATLRVASAAVLVTVAVVVAV